MIVATRTKFLVLWILLLFTSIASAQGFNFADIQWGERVSEIRSKLVSRSFIPGSLDKDGDLTFRGEVSGFKASGVVLFATDGGAQKVIVVLATPDSEARSAYRDIRESLIEKYGQPNHTFETYSRPYFKGDGYEDTAIKVGKLSISTYWLAGASAALSIAITKQLSLILSYEGPQWGEEVARRKAKSRSVL